MQITDARSSAPSKEQNSIARNEQEEGDDDDGQGASSSGWEECLNEQMESSSASDEGHESDLGVDEEVSNGEGSEGEC